MKFPNNGYTLAIFCREFLHFLIFCAVLGNYTENDSGISPFSGIYNCISSGIYWRIHRWFLSGINRVISSKLKKNIFCFFFHLLNSILALGSFLIQSVHYTSELCLTWCKRKTKHTSLFNVLWALTQLLTESFFRHSFFLFLFFYPIRFCACIWICICMYMNLSSSTHAFTAVAVWAKNLFYEFSKSF